MSLDILLDRHKAIGLSCYIYLAYALFYMTGSNNATHNYVQFGLFGLWNLVAMMEDAKSYSYAICNKATTFLCLFLLYYLVTSIFVAELFYTFTYILVFLMLYSFHVQSMYYIRRARMREVNFILKGSFLGWFVIALSAIAFYIANPSAARTLAADFTAFENLYIGGGYSIAFGSSLLFVYLFTIFLKNQIPPKRRKMTIVFMCVLYFLVLKTESTTTLIATTVGAAVSLFITARNSKNKTVRNLLYVAIIFIIIFVLSGGVEYIASMVTSSTDVGSEDLYSRRFNRIAEKVLSFGGSSSSNESNYVDERWGLVVLSFNTFLENPIFGMGYKVGNVFSELSKNGVGTHSEIADLLAQMGLVGALLFFVYIKNSISNLSRKETSKGYIVALLIMALMNPFRHFHGFYVLFFIIPLINVVIYNMENNGHVKY